MKFLVSNLILCLLFLLLSQAGVLAQQTQHTTKIIYLKDGSRVKGKIIQSNPGESITLQVRSGQLFYIQMDDIKRFKTAKLENKGEKIQRLRGEKLYFKDGGRLFAHIVEFEPGDYVTVKVENGDSVTFFDEELTKIKFNQKVIREFTQKGRGYFADIDAGFVIGKVNRYDVVSADLSFHTIHGYRFSQYLQTGLGIGMDRISSINAIPFYLHVAGELGTGKVVPIYYVDLGISRITERSNSFDNYDNMHGGRYTVFGTGLKIKYSKYSLNIKAAYKTQNASLHYTIVDSFGRDFSENDITRQYRRFNLSFGVAF